MSETKFTPEPWHIVDSPTGATRSIYAGNFPICSMAMTDFYGVSEEEKQANADLMAAAPEMYESEAGNLETMKTILECYEDVERLMLTDDDVQQAIKAGSINGLWMHDVVQKIIDELEQRIAETERVLAKARGEQKK